MTRLRDDTPRRENYELEAIAQPREVPVLKNTRGKMALMLESVVGFMQMNTTGEKMHRPRFLGLPKGGA
jgi:hypothetical protein